MQFVSGSSESDIMKLWKVDVENKRNYAGPIQSFPAHDSEDGSSVHALDKLDGYHFVSGSGDGNFHIWSLSFLEQPLQPVVTEKLKDTVGNDSTNMIESFVGTPYGKKVDETKS